MSTMQGESPSDYNAFGTKTTHRKRIDGRDYVTTIHPAGTAFEQLLAIIDLVSGPAGLGIEVLQSLFANGLQGASPSPGGTSAAMKELVQAAHRVGGVQFARDLLEHTHFTCTVNGRAVSGNCSSDFDVAFQGLVPHMLKVCAWVAEVNYLPFFRDAAQGGSFTLEALLSRFNDVSKNYQSAST